MPRKIYLFFLSAGASLILLFLGMAKEKPEHSKTEIINEIMNMSHLIQPECGSMSLLWLISSSTNNTKARDAIRQAYPSSVLEKLRVQRIFLVGKPRHSKESKKYQDLLEESNKYQDLLLGDFLDTYKNLTRKHLMGLNWAAKCCENSKFLAKMDDDIVLDLYSLLKLINNGTISQKTISGYAMRKRAPERKPGNKWFVSQEEYAGETYPDFVSGWFYVTGMEVVKILMSQVKTVAEYFWIDDVFMTGILREHTETRITDLARLYATDFRFLECCLRGKRKKLKCDFLVGPDGGRRELQIKFRNYAEFCDSVCVQRDETHSVKKTCVSSYQEHWKPISGSASINPIEV